ncbi:YhcH/YjgK/YiaL family protein [Actomonas aquatica]|uniref:YhcH/YjgK/YiaL family protein n=1 Tax=Actomonas aquatica TaxID=2866162 RepID=A0ABZ1CBH1_9BACT|nr:YhcH/YjgK/YiaL family protein [Opitutus sp. WL0086]WRQ88801.1 YhcH/YjgK/YiaL family protein [Opitutus sp. WL0086]
MAIWGTLDLISQQLASNERFEAALAYLREALAPGSAVHGRIMAIAEGVTERVDLADGVFALEQVYTGKPAGEGRFEAHDQYVDLQAVLSGEEAMEVTARAGLAVTEDLLADKDVVFLADRAAVSRWVVAPGEIAVFFPGDAHKPSLAAGAAPVLAHKTVVKVRL